MYDVKKLRSFKGKTVGDLTDYLSALPREAEIFCDGDDWFWVHIEADGSTDDADKLPITAPPMMPEEIVFAFAHCKGGDRLKEPTCESALQPRH